MYAYSNHNLAAVVLGACVALAGCGGSDDAKKAAGAFPGIPAFAGAGGGTLTAAELLAGATAINQLNTAIGNGSVTIAPPTSASATMNGFMSATTAPGQIAAGNLTLNADFVGGSFTGSTSDFAVYGSSSTLLESLTGSLAITNGTITGTNMNGNLDGVLTSAATGANTIASTMTGTVFEGNGQNIALGTIAGTITNGAGTNSLSNGAFVAAD